MHRVDIPWAAWYGKAPCRLEFPDSWDVQVCPMRGGKDIGDEGIRRALADSIGAPPLREYAKGRESAAILVDDLSRPTPAFRLLPYVLEELRHAGIGEDRVKIIAAVAAHRPLTRDDFLKKVGPEIVERMQVLNRNAYENLEFLGYSSRGIPISLSPLSKYLMGPPEIRPWSSTSRYICPRVHSVNLDDIPKKPAKITGTVTIHPV